MGHQDIDRAGSTPNVGEDAMQVSTVGGNVVRVTGTLQINDSEELRKEILRELNALPGLVLDLSAVDDCDAASMQLLCALQKSARRAGKTFRIFEPSNAMRECSAILGLSLEDMANV
jgi:anti-anti-sigma factor